MTDLFADPSIGTISTAPRRRAPGQVAAARAWNWPRGELPSVWIPKNIYLPPSVSSVPGYLSFNARPWWRPVVDWTVEPGVQKMFWVAGAQSSKTTTCTGLTAWGAKHRAGMVAWYREKEAAVEEFCEKTLYQIYRNSPNLMAILSRNGRDAIRKKGGLMFESGGSLIIASVGSPSAMISRSPWLLFIDELDKCYRNNAGIGDLIKSAEKRILTHRSVGRIVANSTPTDDDAGIWPHWLSSQQWEWIIDCPDCGWRGPMSFFGFAPDGSKIIDNSNIDFEDMRGGYRWARLADGSHPDPDRLRESDAVWYECPCCAHRTYEKGRSALVLGGSLECMTPGVSSHSRAVHLPSTTAPEYTFAKVASDFLAARHSPSQIVTFRNDTLALPRISRKGASIVVSTLELLRDMSWIQGREGPAQIPKIPAWVEQIYLGVDAQQVEFWAVLEGVGYEGESIVLWAGRIDSKEDLRYLDTMIWQREDGAYLSLSSGGIDTGDGNRTQELYYLISRLSRFLALKGNRSIDRPIVKGNVDFKLPDGSVAEQGLTLYSWHTTTFQDTLQSQIDLGAGTGAGALHVPSDCPREWYEHIRAERRVEVTVKDRPVWVWKPTYVGAPNHLRDAHAMCKVLAFLDGWANQPRPLPMSAAQQAEYLAMISGRPVSEK